MQSSQNQTLGLVLLLLLVLLAGVFATHAQDFLQKLFSYRQVNLDLNPINPNFDWSQLTPKINIPMPSLPNPVNTSPDQPPAPGMLPGQTLPIAPSTD